MTNLEKLQARGANRSVPEEIARQAAIATRRLDWP
jgi:hypothetical protein